MFMPFTVTQGTIVHFMTVSLTLWLGCNQLMIRQSLSSLVMPMLITLSGYSQSVLLIDMGVMFFFCNLPGCEQLVRGPTHIAGNRLYLVMTDVPDIVDVVVGTPLGTSDHCFVSCVLRVEQSVPEYNARSTVSSHCSAVRSFKWSTILKSADSLVAFDRAIGEVIGRYVPTPVLHSRSVDKQWFDASCRRTHDAKQTAYRAWCRARNAEYCRQFVLGRAEAQWVHCAARESHNERTRNTLKLPSSHMSGGRH